MNNIALTNHAWKIIATLAVLVVLAIFTKHQLSSVPSIPDNIPASEFSGQRAYQQLVELLADETAHFVDSQANRLVEQRLIEHLKTLGFTPEIQDTEICSDWRRGVARCTRVRNVIVHIQGEVRGQGILLSAHYDSVPAGPGGSDAGAAVATLMEIARLLADKKQPRNSIVLLFNEGEEFGLFGAHAFMRKHPLAKQLKVALNIEARGSAGKSVMFETGEDSGWLVSEYAKGTTAPLSSSLFYEVYKYLPNDTDLTVFKEHGLQGLNFAHAELEAHYHTPLDNLANLNPGTVQLHGDNVWHVLNQIKDKDLTLVEQGNKVYTDVLGMTVFQWPESWTLWISFMLMGLLVWSNIRYYQLNLLINGNALGCLVMMILSVFIAAISAFVLQKIVQSFGASMAPWRAEPISMRLSIWLGVVSSTLMFCYLAAKNHATTSVLIASMYLWVLLAIVTSLVMPGISFLFILPAGLTLIALIAVSFLGNDKTRQAIIWVAALFAICNAVSFMPIVHTLEVMVSFYMSVAMGIMLGFSTIALVPLLLSELKVVKSIPRIAGVGIILSLSAATWTILQPPYSEKMPQPLNLVYLQNAAQPPVLLVGRSGQSLPPELASKYAAQSEREMLKPFAVSGRDYRATTVDEYPIAQIETAVLQSGVDSGNRVVKFSVNTEKHKLLDVKVHIHSDSKLISLQNSEQKIIYQDEPSIRNGYYEYHCRGESCHQFELIAEWPHQAEEKPLEVQVTASYTGLPSQLNEWVAARDGIAIQRQNGDLSMVSHRLVID
ncbi:M28 family peptidase [Aliikangiella marina]|uniref:Vacuolar membrane protease n=1 Tax=Aliikangiella marina TaxID=1712262 RepID=A0A545TBV8_9GAMM|nr:M28 family peptidase [Aliikangiella marina]TQV74697.1 M28 family peptidase [Aliikangiella marina]